MGKNDVAQLQTPNPEIIMVMVMVMSGEKV
jgi:hypothetical protein